MQNTKILFLFVLILGSFFDALCLENVLRLKVDGNSYSDETVVRFRINASSNFDAAYDAFKFFSSNSNVPSLYTKSLDSMNLAINALSDSAIESSQVKLYFKANVNGNYTISQNFQETFNANTSIVLEDLETGMFVDIRFGNDYTFVHDTNLRLDRFVIHFNKAISVSKNDVHCKNGVDGILNINNTSLSAFRYVLCNMQQDTLLNQQTFLYDSLINIDSLSTGIYYLMVYNQDMAVYIDTLQISEQSSNVNASFVTDDYKFEVSEIINFSNNSDNAITYYWNFGDGYSSNDINPHHIYEDTGMYIVTLTAKDEYCQSISSKNITISNVNIVSGLGSDVEADNITLYPNPTSASQFVYIRGISNLDLMDIVVYDIAGQQININYSNGSNGIQLDLTNTVSGTYFVQLNGKESTITRKISIL